METFSRFFYFRHPRYSPCYNLQFCTVENLTAKQFLWAFKPLKPSYTRSSESSYCPNLSWSSVDYTLSIWLGLSRVNWKSAGWKTTLLLC